MSDPILDAGIEAETVHNKDDPSKSPMAKVDPGKDYPHLKGYFNVDSSQMNDSIRSDLKVVWDYLAQESTTEGDVLYKLRQMENRLAMPPLGQNRISYIADYVKVLRDIGDLGKQRDSFQR
jgi:hypothetical protein